MPPTEKPSPRPRRLLLVLGDQLQTPETCLPDFDPSTDALLLIESRHEAGYVPQHKKRLVLFFSAMRHFRDEQLRKKRRVHYVELTDPDNRQSFADEVPRQLASLRPTELLVTEPGDHRVLVELRSAAKTAGVPLRILDDAHFLCSRKQFEEFAAGKKSLLMETFYRGMRKRSGYLMDGADPIGGRWNYDTDNRETFGKAGPPQHRKPKSFEPDATTRTVAEMVEAEFPEAPGSTAGFDLPVTARQGQAALTDFVEQRLPLYGRFQDAMVAGEPFLFHSRLSSSLNLHLLDPRQAIERSIEAYEDGSAPLNSVEGFVRQVLGWREYVRGIYWREMPDYADRNELGADRSLPSFYWTAETDMRCMRHAVGQLVEHAYAHHIQRLMVLGLFSLLLGVRPKDFNDWHLAMYIDAIDWVSLPNVLGMSQYADGGLLATKPYCASGNYIHKMSDYCSGCRYKPKLAQGEDACPFTTLYWDFLARNEPRLRGNHRMNYQLANLARKPKGDLAAIRRQAAELRDTLGSR